MESIEEEEEEEGLLTSIKTLDDQLCSWSTAVGKAGRCVGQLLESEG